MKYLISLFLLATTHLYALPMDVKGRAEVTQEVDPRKEISDNMAFSMSFKKRWMLDGLTTVDCKVSSGFILDRTQTDIDLSNIYKISVGVDF